MSTWMVVLSLALLFRGWSFSILFLFYLSARSLRGPWFFWLYSYCPIRVPTLSLNVRKNSFITFLSPWILQRLMGIDAIGPELLKECALSLCAPMYHLFQMCISLGCIPVNGKFISSPQFWNLVSPAMLPITDPSPSCVLFPKYLRKYCLNPSPIIFYPTSLHNNSALWKGDHVSSKFSQPWFHYITF